MDHVRIGAMGSDWWVPYPDEGYDYFDFDDVYIDYSLARVELGNSPEWKDCTHREIQIPVSWSDDSIGVVVNQGGFADGEGAWLFVVTEDGEVSDGYAITVGGGSVSDPPVVVLDSPKNNSVLMNEGVSFACSAEDDLGLVNVSLFGNWSGSWVLEASEEVSGLSATVDFAETLPGGMHRWNCLAYDSDGQSAWADEDFVLTIIESAGPNLGGAAR